MKHSLLEDETRLEAPIEADALRGEVRAWAVAIGIEPKEIHIREMSRKWGSCSSNVRLSFSSELRNKPKSFRDEVIVHELLHLKVSNHGKLFRALLCAHIASTPSLEH